MKDYEIRYSKFLADMTEQIANFIQYAYRSGNYDIQNQTEVETEIVDTNNTFENVDNAKVELVEYNEQQPKINKTLLYVAGAIIIWQLLKRK